MAKGVKKRRVSRDGMRRDSAKTQLRHCALCQKVGHNKSTCRTRHRYAQALRAGPEAVSQTNIDHRHSGASKTAHPPLKFFVHHVNYNSHKSPHLINLKEYKNNQYEDVQPVAPKENKDFYFNHKTPINPTLSFSPKKVKNSTVPILLRAKSRIRDFAAKGKIETPKHLVGATLIILFLLFVPAKARTYYFDLKSTANKIADNSAAGFSALRDSTSALMSGNLEGAQESITNALQNFDQAVNVLNSRHQLLQKIVSVIPIMNSEIKSRQKLIAAGQEISLGNTYLLKGLSEIRAGSSTITKNLQLLGAHLTFSLPHYQTAKTDLQKVDSDILPFEYQSTFKEFRILYNAYVGDLENIAKLNSAVQEIFGGQGLRRYLLVFQNPAELRPTGGFMGSFALIDIKDGNIVNIDIPAGGSYDLQGQFTQYVAPPTPLLLANKRWEFQDANWFPDFPASAKKILWFYRHSRNLTADGVIAINANVINRLLSIIGPISEENRNVVLDKENAIVTIQNIVEYGSEKKDNKPKQIISDLAPLFINNFKKIKAQAVLPMLANLEEALEQKEIQSYFTDDDTENTIKEFGWSGEILNTSPDQDYLFVVNTNIQGQKSDAKIKQTISHQAVVQPDGVILDSVVISREHTGQPGEKLYGQTNIDYLRIYVPAGSELVRASGFTWPDEQKFKAPESWYKKDAALTGLEKETGMDRQSGTRITSEFNKTAFANWIITEPGQTNQVQFIYKLPFKAWEQPKESSLNNWAKIFQSKNPASKYQLVAQKQSGINSSFESQIIYPDEWSPIWQDGDGITLATNGAAINPTELSSDKIWSLVMGKDSAD